MGMRMVVADQSEARFYDTDHFDSELKLVARLADPKARLHDRDFKADRLGRYSIALRPRPDAEVAYATTAGAVSGIPIDTRRNSSPSKSLPSSRVHCGRINSNAWFLSLALSFSGSCARSCPNRSIWRSLPRSARTWYTLPMQ